MSNFFLSALVASLDRILENTLIPYGAVSALAARSVLVLAPHPDDEVFGCGGSILAHVEGKVPVSVVVLTDGALAGDAAQRMQESLAAAKILSYGEPEFWHLPDRGLSYSEALVLKIADHIAAHAVDLVYAPSPWEIHPDHRQASWLAIEAVRRVSIPVQLAFYEVGAPLRPNVLLNITQHWDAKEKAMRCFGSQLKNQDYLRHIRALNQFRTYTLSSEVSAAEAFWLVDAAKLEQLLATEVLKPVSPGLLLPMVSQVQSHMPLVSILVRSMDRPYLAAALDSVALQTYPHIEIVVIAVHPQHQPLSPKCASYPIRLIETDKPLPRSQAANRALAHARGEYCLFLDDDDWLMPDHITRLIHVLLRQRHAFAAYTGISLVDASGAPLGQAFDLPFDGLSQLAGNLMPIHAVLFRSCAVAQGCLFDETLDRYEDWDFWLQLAKLGPMVHLPGISGVYRIHQSSGVHDDAGTSSASTATIYQKWVKQWTPEQMGLMMHRVWTHPELEVQLQDARALNALAETSLDDLRRLSATLQGDAEHERSRAQCADRERILALEQVNNLHATLTAQQQTLQSTAAALEMSLHNLQTTTALSQKNAAENQIIIDSQIAEIRQLHEQLANFHRSASWRLTAPVRWVTSKLQLRRWLR